MNSILCILRVQEQPGCTGRMAIDVGKGVAKEPMGCLDTLTTQHLTQRSSNWSHGEELGRKRRGGEGKGHSQKHRGEEGSREHLNIVGPHSFPTDQTAYLALLPAHHAGWDGFHSKVHGKFHCAAYNWAALPHSCFQPEESQISALNPKYSCINFPTMKDVGELPPGQRGPHGHIK